MFDDDVRRLVQVASIANAVGAADNAAPWRALLWLAGQVEAGTLAARLYIPVRMRTVDTTRASRDESLVVWRGMAKRVKAARTDSRLKLDQRDSYLPSATSTWHVHVNDLLQFIDTAEMHDAVRAELRELAQRYRGAADEPPTFQLGNAGMDEATAAGPSAGPDVADRGRRLKRRALIDALRRRWPTVERDLQDGADNGLSKAARGDAVGWWWEGPALEWAEQRGKLIEATATAAIWPGTTIAHRMED